MTLMVSLFVCVLLVPQLITSDIEGGIVSIEGLHVNSVTGCNDCNDGYNKCPDNIHPFAYKTNDSYISNERRLYRDILKDYEKTVRPVRNESETVRVRLGLALTGIENLDEERQVLHAKGRLRTAWSDFQLQWDPADYGGVNEIRVPIANLWSPDLALYNSVTPDKPLQSSGMAIAVFDGSVLWIPPVSLSIICPIDLTYFPFDTQTCAFKIGSWTYDQSRVDLVPFSAELDENLDLFDFYQSKLWKLVDTSTKHNVNRYPCCRESFIDMEFVMRLQRHSTLALHLFFAPTVSLSLVIPAVFVMPAGSTEKIALGAGVLIAHVLLLGELIDYLPSKQHVSLPLMARFFVANIVLVSLSLIISSIIINIWSRGSSRLEGPSAIIKKVFLNQFIARLLCFDFSQHRYDFETKTNKSDTSKPTGTGGLVETAPIESINNDEQTIQTDSLADRHFSAASEWMLLADVVDRIFLILYLIVVVVLCLGCLGYL